LPWRIGIDQAEAAIRQCADLGRELDLLSGAAIAPLEGRGV
jgi:hypothetical protein